MIVSKRREHEEEGEFLMTTVLSDCGRAEVSALSGGEDDLWLSAQACRVASGWELRPEGLCRDGICVPVPAAGGQDYVRDGAVNLAAFWRLMDKPLAHDEDGEVWALGEGAGDRAARLATLEAPDFSLPDLAGVRHALSDYRGKKVFLATWASW